MIQNPNHRESGCKSLIINGKEMPDNYIPACELLDENDIIFTMS